MTLVHIPNTEQRDLVGPGGRAFRLRPGILSGELRLSPYAESRYLIAPEDGMLELLFRFRSEDGRPWRHSSIFKSYRLWPSNADKITRQQRAFEPQFHVKTVFDWREPFALELSEGGRITGFFKYTEVAFEAAVAPDGLAVRCRFYSTQSGGYETVCYALPLERLLWCRAPLLIDVDELIPESGNHVDIAPDTEKGLSGTAISPVEIVGEEQGETRQAERRQ
jgi:hypothetical protein